jgi:lysozyme family protein
VKANFEQALAAILHHEGGFVNHPKDPGGMTNLGVTRRAWQAYVGREVDEIEMRTLTPKAVAPFYKTRYWDAVKGDDLPTGVDYCVFDAAVNSGPGQAAKWLQRAVGAKADGAIGPKTLAMVASHKPSQVVAGFVEQRLAFLQGLSTFETFGRGWTRRVNEVAKVAGDMTELA